VTEDEFTEIVDRLLEVGVPPTAVAKAFDIDPFVVRDRMNGLRISKYGAAELSEALAVMQWDALDECRAMIHDAPYNVRSRFIMAILSKTMSLTARQNPETLGAMRANILELYQQALGSEGDDPLESADPDAFVPAAPSDDDKDQGPDD
jgi:hypothetical protein